MNHENLKVLYNCGKCAFCQPVEGDGGECHQKPPAGSGKYPPVSISTGWCAEHQSGKEEASVPDVVGLGVAEAIAAIGAVVVLPVQVNPRVEGEPADTVIGQNPTGGTLITPNTIVSLTATRE